MGAQKSNESIDSTGKVSLNTSALFFIKNNEYKGPFTRGFTGIGAILKPELQFVIDPKASLNVGYYFLKYSGINTSTEALPLFSFTYDWTDHISLTLGAIEGNLHHQLDQAHYQIDQYYQQHVEYGFQCSIKSKVLQSELWLDWRQFIKRNDPFPEKFIVGFNNRVKVIDRSNFNFIFESENIMGHIGGEIDASNEAVQTTLNAKLGIELAFYNWIWSVDYFTFNISGSESITNTKRQLPFQSGYAYKVGLGYKASKWSSHLYYWKANDYFSPMGEPLLFSVSDFEPSIYIPDRKILMHDVSLDLIDINQYEISFYFNNYYDLIQNELSASIELRATITLDYLLDGLQLSTL